ncbi:MAG: DUF413 domain-containing protein, partial [Deltaproteobacteria bacterium]|nr:DUF413 domain-containing protein [Deltaproteobacteria bacterium]
MIPIPLENKQEITSRLDQLESDYRRGELRGIVIAHPVLIISFAVPATLLIAFMNLVLVPYFGEGIGLLMGLILFVMLIFVIFDVLYNMLTRWAFSSTSKIPIVTAFDEAFPHDKGEEREMALNILDHEFEKYAIAKAILGSPTGLDLETFGELFATTGEDPVGEEEFAFQCDPNLLKDDTIKALTHYGNRLQALATGEMRPETDEQEHFVQVHRTEEDPFTQPERIWRTYQDAIRWQSYVDSMDDPTLSEYLRSYPYVDEKSQYVHRRVKETEPEPVVEDGLESESELS